MFERQSVMHASVHCPLRGPKSTANLCLPALLLQVMLIEIEVVPAATKNTL
jgi:hypothetical protein